MTIKEVASVIDDINEWQGPHGSIFYVTAIFTDESVGSVGRKDHDAALEVQGLLRESIGQELDFTLEPKGQTKGGREKWAIKGFSSAGGAPIYTAPSVQGDGNRGRNVSPGGNAPERGSARSPEQSSDIRRAVALKAAASCVVGTSPEDVLKFADVFEAWLARTSEPASSAYAEGGGTESAPPSGPPDVPAGASSEDRGEGEDKSDGGSSSGDSPSPHIHDYQLRQGVKGFLVCECGKTRKKETVP